MHFPKKCVIHRNTENPIQKGLQRQAMLPSHINYLVWSLFPLSNKAFYVYTGTSIIHIMRIYNPNDSTANRIPCCDRNCPMKQGLFFRTFVHPSRRFLRIGSIVFLKSWRGFRGNIAVIQQSNFIQQNKELFLFERTTIIVQVQLDVMNLLMVLLL